VQSSHSLEELLKQAKDYVRSFGRIHPVTAALLEARGVNVGVLETRLLTQQGAA
jgi:hypothetical protein